MVQSRKLHIRNGSDNVPRHETMFEFWREERFPRRIFLDRTVYRISHMCLFMRARKAPIQSSDPSRFFRAPKEGLGFHFPAKLDAILADFLAQIERVGWFSISFLPGDSLNL